MTPLQARLFEPVIAVHVLAAVLAVCLGLLVLAARKGTPLHRRAGRAWVVAMTVTAAGSFLIDAQLLGIDTPLGRFGPIHLLSAGTLVALGRAIVAVRAGRVAEHRRAMIGAYAGLAVAGLFTVAPGRTLGAWLAAALA